MRYATIAPGSLGQTEPVERSFQPERSVAATALVLTLKNSKPRNERFDACAGILTGAYPVSTWTKSAARRAEAWPADRRCLLPLPRPPRFVGLAAEQRHRHLGRLIRLGQNSRTGLRKNLISGERCGLERNVSVLDAA